MGKANGQIIGRHEPSWLLKFTPMLASPSVHAGYYSKLKWRRKTNIGMSVSQSWNNWCANFQVGARVSVAETIMWMAAKMSALSRGIFLVD